MKKLSKPVILNITLGNKIFYSVLIVIVITFIAGITIALNSWEIMGHSPENIGIGNKSVQERLCSLEALGSISEPTCSSINRCQTNNNCIWEIMGHSPEDIGIGDISIQQRLCALETLRNIAEPDCPDLCIENGDCITAYKYVCKTSATPKYCVECTQNSDCTFDANRPICDANTNTCRDCTWQIAGQKTITGYQRVSHTTFPLPSICKSGGGCDMRYQVTSTAYSLTMDRIVEGKFTQASDNTWTYIWAKTEGVGQGNGNSDGTNGNVNENIYPYSYISDVNGNIYLQGYFRDDCVTNGDTSPDYLCLTSSQAHLPFEGHTFTQTVSVCM